MVWIDAAFKAIPALPTNLTMDRLNNLSNDELNTLWFRCDEYLSDEELELVYHEMQVRGMKKVK